jgi:hypothetical protein
MFSRAARCCFDDAIFVTSISSLGLTLRYRSKAQQQICEIQVIDQRGKVDAFRLKGVARTARQTTGNHFEAARFPIRESLGDCACNKAKETSRYVLFVHEYDSLNHSYSIVDWSLTFVAV